MKHLLPLWAFCLLFCPGLLLAQNVETHSTGKAWVSPESGSKGTELAINVEITSEPGWHIYSTIETGAYMPTMMEVASTSQGIELVGEVSETGEIINKFDEIMDGDLNYFKEAGTFVQKIKITKNSPVIAGRVDYQECNDMKCIFSTYEFELSVKPE